MLQEHGGMPEAELTRRHPPGHRQPMPLPPYVGSHAERLQIATATGYPGAACLTNRDRERSLLARLDWEL